MKKSYVFPCVLDKSPGSNKIVGRCNLRKTVEADVSPGAVEGPPLPGLSGTRPAEPPGFAEWPGSRRLFNRLQKSFFDGLSRLTDRYPRAGSRLIDRGIRPVAAHPLLAAASAQRNRHVMRGLRSFDRFLIVPDIHIGDAVMSQSALAALRDFFPTARVDYIVNRSAHPLIDGHTEATRVLPFFSTSTFPSRADLSALEALIRGERYDLVLNFCPYVDERDIDLAGARLLNFLTHAPVILQNEQRPSEINHFAFQTYKFVRLWLSRVAAPRRRDRFPGLRVTIDEAAFEEARRFASQAGLRPEEPVIMYNPDAASPFTRMPFDKQAALLAALARLDAILLVGAGHTQAGIGERLVSSLAPRLRRNSRIVPTSLSLSGYAALADFCDVFLTGDTGPLHLAAARKHARSGSRVFRNRTAVLGIFGATPSRMSGYDSSHPGYLPASQDAPSRAYVAGSPCRNSSCVNKSFKTCRVVRCFEKVDVEDLVAWTRACLQLTPRRTFAPRDAEAAR
jgi:ADP-heptose:LPS heptosyltransferase